jgi:predicted RNA-binding protein YlxR (DUF448 family)
MARRTALPTRMCVGCGVRAAKSDLLRLVAAGDEIIPDAAARLPGRGAYLHPSRDCLERAQRRKALARALRLPGSASAGAGPAGAGLAGYLAAGEAGRTSERQDVREQAEIAMSTR